MLIYHVVVFNRCLLLRISQAERVLSDEMFSVWVDFMTHRKKKISTNFKISTLKMKYDYKDPL